MNKELPETLTLEGTIVPVTNLQLADNDNIIRIRASDTTEIERWFGQVVMSHDADHLSLDRYNSGRSQFIKDHKSSSVDGVLGVITHSEILDGALFVNVQLTDRPEVAGIIGDIKAGIVSNVSIGTKITEVLSQEVDDDGVDHYVLAHEPYELSLVVVGAIPSARIIKASDGDETNETTPIENKSINKNIASDDVLDLEVGSQSNESVEASDNVGSQSDKVVDKEQEQEKQTINNKEIIKMSENTDVLKLERERVAEITALSKTHNVDATEALASDTSVDKFRAVVLSQIETKAVPAQVPTEVGLTDKEAESFSFLKATKAAATGDWTKAGFERAASMAAAELSGHTVGANSFVIPAEIQAASVASNPALVATERLPFLEGLFAKTLLNKLNTTNLFDLTGDYEAPKMSGTSVGWVGEDVAGTPSDITSGLMTLTPKTAIGIVPITHKMLNQNSVSVENQIRNLLSKSMAKGIDDAVLFSGNGTTAPKALTTIAGVNAIDATAGLTWALITQAYRDLMLDDVDDAAMLWLSNPTVVNVLQNTLRSVGDTASNYILNSSKDDLNGYGVVQSTVVPATTMVFGDFSKLVIGTWNTPLIDVNPYGKFTDGGIDMRIMTDIDSTVEEEKAFCVISNI